MGPLDERYFYGNIGLIHSVLNSNVACKLNFFFRDRIRNDQVCHGSVTVTITGNNQSYRVVNWLDLVTSHAKRGYLSPNSTVLGSKWS